MRLLFLGKGIKERTNNCFLAVRLGQANVSSHILELQVGDHQVSSCENLESVEIKLLINSVLKQKLFSKYLGSCPVMAFPNSLIQ